jgi:transporter family protein
MTWVVWAMLSAMFAAATALLAKVGVEHIDSNLATAIRTTVVLVFTWAIALSLNAHHGLSSIGRRSWVFLVLSGLCTGLSWICYFRALQLGPVSGVAPIDKLSVAIVILAGWLFFGESMTPMKIVGGSLITAGALVLDMA